MGGRFRSLGLKGNQDGPSPAPDGHSYYRDIESLLGEDQTKS